MPRIGPHPITGKPVQFGRLRPIVGNGPLPPRGNGDLRQWARHVVEKVKVATQAGRLNFLPYWDNDTEETADIRELYPRMLREPIIKCALQEKVLAVAALPVQINPADKKNARDQEVAQGFKHSLDRARGGTYKLCLSIFRPALIKGWSLTEKVWDTETEGRFAGKWVYRDFKSKPIKGLRLGTDEFLNVHSIEAAINNSGRIFDIRDFILYTHLSLYENPTGISDLRSSTRAFWIKDATWKLRSIHLTKWTGPFIKGEYDSQAQKEELDRALEESRSESWITVPKGMLVSAMEFSTRGTVDYEAALKDCDREMLIGITGAYLHILEGATPDGRGDTGIHKETSELFQWALAMEYQNILNQELAPEWTRDNYYKAEPPKATVGAVNEGDLEAATRVDEALQRMGAKLSKRDRMEFYSRAEPENEADVLVPLPPAAPAGPPGLPFADATAAPVAFGAASATTPAAAPADGQFADPAQPAAGVPAAPFRPGPGQRTSWGYTVRGED